MKSFVVRVKKGWNTWYTHSVKCLDLLHIHLRKPHPASTELLFFRRLQYNDENLLTLLLANEVNTALALERRLLK